MTSGGLPAQAQLHPLSSAQRGLWLTHQLSASRRAYTLAWRVDLRGPFNLAHFTRAVEEVAQRHSALRTKFAMRDGHPVQIVLPAVVVPVQVEDLRDLPDAETAHWIEDTCAAERAASFELMTAPLIRYRVLRIDELHTVVLVAVHHIVFDGLSKDILLDELAALYAANAEGAPIPPPPAMQYTDFVTYENHVLREERLERLTRYWREQLAGCPELLELPVDRPRPGTRTFAGAEFRHRLPAELTDPLHALAGSERATLFMVMLSAYQILLSRHSGQQDFCVGSNVSGRLRNEFSTTIGYFVNPLVMRADLTGEPSFREVLRRVRQTCLGAYDHQDLPFGQVVTQIRPHRSSGHSPIFQTSFNMRYEDSRSRRFANLEVASVAGLETTYTKYDLSITAVKTGTDIELDVEYATDIFDASTVRRLVARFEQLLVAAATDPELPTSHLELVSPPERRQVLRAGNGPQRPLADVPLGAMFTAQAVRTPNAVAVTADGQDISYAQLDARSDDLAYVLRANDVQVEDLVAVALPPGIELVIAVLGVLKTGAAYVPIDPSYPARRISFMVSDAKPAVVLSTSAAWDMSAGPGVPTIALDEPRTWAELPPGRAPSDMNTRQLDPDNAAYVIYTSGSTGIPKGVVVSHRSVANYLSFAVDAYPSLRRGALLHSSISFDLSVTALFGTLLFGGRLHLIPPLDGRVAADFVSDEGAFLKVTPSHLSLLNSLATQDSSLGDLVTGGEPLPGETVQAWRARHPGTHIVNEYGPTETTVGCTALSLAPGNPIPGGILPIGRPIPNTRIYVLDERCQPVGIGITGELYVAGACVARGYLGRAALTAQRFVPCPFEAGQRMYRTGDLARWDGHGQLRFSGRVDHQVKVRGHRVEPDEIEVALVDHPAISRAVVVGRPDRLGDLRLHAYVELAASHTLLTPDDLKRHLGGSLPSYMVPSHYVFLDQLPLTDNGKVDRDALPDPSAVGDTRRDKPAAMVAPGGDLESLVAVLFADALGREMVLADDDFFRLGGDSLTVVRVIHLVRETLNEEPDHALLFEAPTPALFARAILCRAEDPADVEKRAAAALAVLHLTDDEVREQLGLDVPVISPGTC